MQLNNPSLLRSEAYINGAWVSAADGKTFAVRNPVSGDVIAEAADLVRKRGMVSKGGHIVVVAGMPFGIAGTTNSMRVVRI